MYDDLGQGVTVIGRFHHVVGATLYLLAKRWSGAGRDDIFDFRNHVLTEGIPHLAIGEFICVPTIECLGVHATRIVELDKGVLYEISVGQFLVGFGMRRNKHLYFLDGLEHDIDELVSIHGIVEVE